ncbi:cupredoxin domain-containing protein [Hydrocarboniclastica marina]|uniref:Copper-binding protein n=1 Tax=Hydrocarboniclastica marina TaxID=2259620 RepID=A0A4P7XLL2_9ALTE|nr:plastocyanin/azurin family copper-binding protein [Hydrocarboniclastica marina]QCF28061.1 copper-binding protein [Hydrocarboniclastica marina]
MKKHRLVSVIASLTLSLSGVVLAAPGHGDGHHADSTIGQPGEAAEASRTVEVVMYDNYYDPEEINVDEGETVRFVVKNEGMLVHEFNIGTAAMHAAHQDEMMMMVEHGVIQGDSINREMMKMDMGNGQTMEHDDPNSVLLEPGESAEVVWTFGENADLEFACNVPGHYDAGMMGQIEVQ